MINFEVWYAMILSGYLSPVINHPEGKHPRGNYSAMYYSLEGYSSAGMRNLSWMGGSNNTKHEASLISNYASTVDLEGTFEGHSHQPSSVV